MDISIENLSLSMITGLNEFQLNNIFKIYNDKIESLKYLNMIRQNNFVKNNLNKFDPITFDLLISKYWGKTFKNIKFKKYKNETYEFYIFGILENVLNITNEKFDDLFVVYILNDDILSFLNEGDIENLMKGFYL